MSKEILEITPAGGIYCLVNPRDLKARAVIHCAKPSGYALDELLNQVRLQDDIDNIFRTDGDILRWALSRICEAPTGRALAHDARFDEWTISIENGDHHDAPIQIDDKTKHLMITRHVESVAVFSRSPDAQMRFMFDMLKSLRLIWQAGLMTGNPEGLAPEDYIKFSRLSEADADLCSILSAYQMRGRGSPELWRHILSSDLSSLAVTLCECLDYDATEDGLLDAMGFVFQDWFLDDARVARVDHISLAKLDARLSSDDAHDDLEFDDILRLSMLPEGGSYLEYAASDILSDEFYSRMTSDITDAHLKQIVRETEIDMIENIGFRDPELARKFFPQSTFETIV